MTKGQQRFKYFLDKLQDLLDAAAKQKNPALWLYQNNARTPLFMLEGLAKLYAGLNNKKKFDKLKAHFKVFEDALGQVDYYDSSAKAFADDKNIPARIVDYLQAQSREKIQSLNEILVEKGWISESKTRIEKIRKKLEEPKWKSGKKEIKEIQQYYISSINKILEFVNEKDFEFSDIENDVHELRRMIRWLSIYPQALRGCIQLSNSGGQVAEHLTKYLTPEITESPYNVMPDAADNSYFLLLDRNRFLAMSWLIAELGNLKDSGLKVEVLQEAILQTSKSSEKTALSKAYKLAGDGQLTLEQLLSSAQDLVKIYCKEHNLEALIVGTAATAP